MVCTARDPPPLWSSLLSSLLSLHFGLQSFFSFIPLESVFFLFIAFLLIVHSFSLLFLVSSHIPFYPFSVRSFCLSDTFIAKYDIVLSIAKCQRKGDENAQTIMSSYTASFVSRTDKSVEISVEEEY